MKKPEEDTSLPNDIPDEFKRAHVIIIDDDPANRVLLRGVCEKMNIGIIDEAEDGVEALDLIARFRPDLLLLDIKMPRMDGMELMRQLRANPVYDYLSILVQTGLQGVDDRVTCFNLGATDVVSRPFHIPELKARICAHLRSAISARILFDFRNRIQAHLEITHNFLSAILPTPEQTENLAQQYGLVCSSVYRPHDEIGGDLWTLRAIDDDNIAIIVIDASAHGLAGAINALRVDCLVQVNQGLLNDPAAFLNKLDADMAKISFGQLFAGAIVLSFNKKTGRLVFAGSGNPSPLLYHYNSLKPLRTEGMLLGSGLLKLKNQEIILDPMDTLVLFSDGWSDGSDIDEVKTIDTLNKPGVALAAALAPEDYQITDDLTLLTIQRSKNHGF
ncbi:MAG: response regulator [Alphaproteobacteria bacterium]|nr:response regulator [Alphaproteobacteria bacterium]